VEVLTCIHCSPNEQIKSNTEVHGGNRIQDARDPFVFVGYGVSSIMVEVSERAQIDDEETLNL